MVSPHDDHILKYESHYGQVTLRKPGVTCSWSAKKDLCVPKMGEPDKVSVADLKKEFLLVFPVWIHMNLCFGSGGKFLG